MALYTGPTNTSSYYEGLIRGTALNVGVEPETAIRLARFESGLNPTAVSTTGAIGLFQLMPSTAQQYGVNPFDPIQNIYGGLAVWRDALARVRGDPALAYATVYNPGYPLASAQKIFAGAPVEKASICLFGQCFRIPGVAAGTSIVPPPAAGSGIPSTGDQATSESTPILNTPFGVVSLPNQAVIRTIVILAGLILIAVGGAALARGNGKALRVA